MNYQKEILLLLMCLVLFLSDSVAQDWRKLVPLVSKCSDVKKILNVDTCDFPSSDYRLPEFGISINFSSRDKHRSPTVTRVIISFKKWVSLKEFESDLSGYEILPDGDLQNSKIYKNDRKGISFSAQDVFEDGERYVTGVTLYPKKITKRKKSIR